MKRLDGGKNMYDIPQEYFEGLKTALRLAGYIPNKRINQEMWNKLNNEIDNITLKQIDEHCFQEQLIIDDNRKRNLYKAQKRLVRMMGALSGFVFNPFNRY